MRLADTAEEGVMHTLLYGATDLRWHLWNVMGRLHTREPVN